MMNWLKYLAPALCLVMLNACYEPGKIEVQNNISQAKIRNVQWGEHFLGSELLPGQGSGQITIERFEEKLPAVHKVSFTLNASNRLVFLETEEEYSLDEGGRLLIIIDDSTKVKNPNQ